MRKGLKRLTWVTSSIVFLSGGLQHVFAKWVRVKSEFGPAPHPAQIWLLRAHGISGLFFFFVFGLVYAGHVKPKLRGKDGKLSGLPLLWALAALGLSVPFLYYLSDETAKSWVAIVHTYVGFAAILIFMTHGFKRRRPAKRYRARE